MQGKPSMHKMFCSEKDYILTELLTWEMDINVSLRWSPACTLVINLSP